MRIDLVLLTELAQLCDGVLGSLRQKQGLFLGAEAQQRANLGPPGHDETAVAPGSTTATNILFQYHNIDIGVALLEGERRPQPHEATADDSDVGIVFTFQRQCRL
ncbi:hypothetical protein D3C76_1572180 [compost metagenome]